MIAKQNDNKTQMVAPAKKVKIEALQPLRIDDMELAVGEQVEVSPEQAEEFLKPYTLHYSFGGERSDQDATRYTRVRARLVEHTPAN
jgi:hypothetical protein